MACRLRCWGPTTATRSWTIAAPFAEIGDLGPPQRAQILDDGLVPAVKCDSEVIVADTRCSWETEVGIGGGPTYDIGSSLRSATE